MTNSFSLPRYLPRLYKGALRRSHSLHEISIGLCWLIRVEAKLHFSALAIFPLSRCVVTMAKPTQRAD